MCTAVSARSAVDAKSSKTSLELVEKIHVRGSLAEGCSGWTHKKSMQAMMPYIAEVSASRSTRPMPLPPAWPADLSSIEDIAFGEKRPPVRSSNQPMISAEHLG